MMRKILVSVILLVSFYAQAQYSPTGTKTKFVNGIALGTKDTNTLKNAGDTINLTVSPDSTLRFRYKGYYRPLAFDVIGGYLPLTAGTGYKLTGDLYINKAVNPSIVFESGGTSGMVYQPTLGNIIYIVDQATGLKGIGVSTTTGSLQQLGTGTLSWNGQIIGASSITGGATTVTSLASSGPITGTTLSGTIVTAAQPNITSVGAITGGSLASGFGSINIGTNSITSGAIAGTISSTSVAIQGTNNGSGIAVNGNSANGIGVYANSAAAANPAFVAIHTGGYRIAEFSNGSVVSHIANNGSFNGSVVGGTISGTTGTFSGIAASNQVNISDAGLGVVLQGYVANTLRLAVLGSGPTGGSRASIVGQAADFEGSVKGADFRLVALNTAPATAASTGTTGEIRFDANHIYVCVATNTWKRVAIATW